MFRRKDRWVGQAVPSIPELQFTKLVARTARGSVYRAARRDDECRSDALTIKIYPRMRETDDQPEIEFIATSEGIGIDRCIKALYDEAFWFNFFGPPEHIPLGALMEKGPQDVFTVASIVEQVARALTGIHARHVVHRKLDANSVLFAPDFFSLRPIVHVADFDDAMFVSGPHASLVPRAQRVASAYAPLEQRAGADLGTPADVYAMARIANHLLTGRRVRDWERETQTCREAWPSVPARLAEILHASLSRWPSARPTAQEVWAAAAAVSYESEPTWGRILQRISEEQKSN